MSTSQVEPDKSNDPLVTVIIPAFNRADYIDQTIGCVLEQSYPAVELIVIDDGSTDGTLEKVRAYGDRLTLLTHPDHGNRGQSASINMGLLRAMGEFIAVLDSDDYWEPDKLEKQVVYLQQHPDVGLVYSNGYGVDSEGNRLYPIYREGHVEPNDPGLLLQDCYVSSPSGWLVRKSVYDGVGRFEENYRSAQDHDMLIRIAEQTNFAYMPDYLWYYRRHANSISNTRQGLRWQTGFRILESARKRYPYSPGTIRKRKAVLNYRLGRVKMQEGRFVSGIAQLAHAFLLDPLRALKVVAGIDKSR
jgi:glycosyltransferase involved in cell wall biosynthesis